jgi:hypothetical protein
MFRARKLSRALALVCLTAVVGGPAYAATPPMPGGEANVESLAKVDNPWAMA